MWTLVLVGSCALAIGCSRPHWMHPPEPCVFQPGASKEEVFAHINQNIQGGPGQTGLNSWWCNSARLHLSGVGVPVPPLSAMVAVQHPRNFRMTVANPIGGREVDIGSNSEEFWVWTKEAPQIAVVKHEDLSLALTQLPMPVHIHPDWMMEVFGVIPLDPSEFQEVESAQPGPIMELVALRNSPMGEPMERVLNINVCRGRIVEHSLRRPGGGVMARAVLDRYIDSPGSPSVPTVIRLDWPETGIAMTMNLNQTEVNPPAIAANTSLFTIPNINGSEVVDLGDAVRFKNQHGVLPGTSPGTAAAELSNAQPADPDAHRARGQEWYAEAAEGEERLQFDFEQPAVSEQSASAVQSAEFAANPFERYRPTQKVAAQHPDDAPLWNPQPAPAPISTSPPGGFVSPVSQSAQPRTGSGQRSAYSAGAWRSSSDRHPLELE